MAAEAKKTSILKIWEQSDDAKKKVNRQENLESLQMSAESYLFEARKARNEAVKNYNRQLLAAEKSPNFGAIAQANLVVKATELEYKEAVSVYESVMGETPKIVTV